jgi:transmembrane sensor
MMANDCPPFDPEREAAAYWFARMRRPDAVLFKAEFEQWLAESEKHRRAYNQIAETFSLGKNLTADLASPGGTLRPRTAARRGELLFVALTVILGCGFAVALWCERFGLSNALSITAGADRASSVELSTNTGQLKSVRLADGSLVTLDSNSHVAATFTKSNRILRVGQGRARFAVAHETRPFIVDAGTGRVIARGTVFDVTVGNDGQIEVKLLQGVVDVYARTALHTHAQSSHGRRLAAGQQLAISQGTPALSVTSLTDDGWMHSPIDYDGARLADLVAQANFKAARPIRLQGNGLGEIKVSGTFRVSDTGRLAARIADLFDLTDDTSSPSEIVLRRP